MKNKSPYYILLGFIARYEISRQVSKYGGSLTDVKEEFMAQCSEDERAVIEVYQQCRMEALDNVAKEMGIDMENLKG